MTTKSVWLSPVGDATELYGWYLGCNDEQVLYRMLFGYGV